MNYIRYQWKGMPLLISNTKPLDVMSAVPPCQYCGADRVYELQLMPALVPLLKSKEHNIESPSNLTKEMNRNALFGKTDSGCLSNNASSPYMGENSSSSLVDKSNESAYNTKSTPNMDLNDQFSLTADNNRAAPYIDGKDTSNQFSLAAENNRETKDTDTQSLLVDKGKEDHIWEKHSNNEEGTVISESPSEGFMDVTQFKSNVYKSGITRIEFGTVIVFSCSQSCWESEKSSLREEFVMVQADPDEDIFNKKVGTY